MLKEDQILVTGSSGFVGAHLLRALPRARTLDRRVHDLRRPETLRELLAGVEAVVHLAGLPVGTGYAPSARELILSNSEATLGLLKAIHDHSGGRPRLLFLSSIHVYGSENVELVEELPAAPASVYGAIKHAQEILIRLATEAGWIHGWIFRSTHLYGPGSKPFYNSAVATLCDHALHDRPIDLHGGGRSELDLLYVEDAVRYLVRALSAPVRDSPVVLNLASGRSIALSRLVETLERVAGRPLRRNLIEGPARSSRISVKRLHETLGALELTPLEQGLRAQLEAASKSRPG